MNLRTPFYLHVFIEKTRKGKQRYIDTYLRSTRFFFCTQFFFMFMVMLKRLGLLSSRPCYRLRRTCENT